MLKKDIYKLAEKLKKDMEYLGISQPMAAAVLGVTPRTVGNYLNGATSDKDNLRKLQQYLRSEEFCKGYSFMHRNDFSAFFSQLWIKFRDIMSSDELCDKLGIKLSEANHLRNNSKCYNVRRQYEVLETFYDMCFDYTGVYIDGFEDTAKNLRKILGYDFPEAVTDNFADLLSEIINRLDFGIGFLAEKSGVPADDIEDILSSSDSYYDVWKKCDILDAIRTACLEHGSANSMNLYRELNWKLQYYDERMMTEEEYYGERTEIAVREFKGFPKEVQAAALNHQNVFFDNPASCYDNCFWDYIHFYRLPCELFPEFCDEEFYSTLSDHEYYRRITDLFRDLSESGKDTILLDLEKSCHIPLCAQNENEQFCFRYAVECLDMSLALKENRQYTELLPALRWKWEYFSIEKMKFLLTLDSREWCLHALLMTAVCTDTDLNPFIYKMIYMVNENASVQ